jgi:hypothetical protein
MLANKSHLIRQDVSPRGAGQDNIMASEAELPRHARWSEAPPRWTSPKAKVDPNEASFGERLKEMSGLAERGQNNNRDTSEAEPAFP